MVKRLGGIEQAKPRLPNRWRRTRPLSASPKGASHVRTAPSIELDSNRKQSTGRRKGAVQAQVSRSGLFEAEAIREVNAEAHQERVTANAEMASDERTLQRLVKKGDEAAVVLPRQVVDMLRIRSAEQCGRWDLLESRQFV
jgi:hypothetical protein